ncbi:MAG: hypothetical protein IJ106_14105 [Parasporobacterium sp.]|nr:hypothetical protein [Parasporobacterium sp.]
MKLLGNHIPVFAKMTGIVNGNYFQDGPNGMTEASMDEVSGSSSMKAAVAQNGPWVDKMKFDMR